MTGKHYIIIFLTFFFIFFPSYDVVKADVWQTKGPYGGPIYSLAISKTDPEILYAGTPVGLFKTSDKGASWTNLCPATTITFVMVDPANSDIVYAVGFYDGLRKTTDGGVTWIYQSLSGVKTMTIDPKNSNILYAGVESFPQRKISKSTDGGATWETLISWDMEGPIWEQKVSSLYCIHVDLDDSSCIYVGLKGYTDFGGFLKSTDGGKTWADKKLGSLTGDAIFSMAIGPAGIIYAVNISNALQPKLYRSEDRGESWTQTILPDPGRLTVDSHNSNVLYMGSYKSTDGGQTWALKINGLPEYPSSWRHIVIDPENGNNIYVGLLDSGIYKSINGAENWEFSSQGINNTTIEDIAVHPASSDVAYAAIHGDGHYLAKTNDSGKSWKYLSNSPKNLGAVAIASQNPSIVWAGDGLHFAGKFYIHKSLDGGQTWTSLNFLTIVGSSQSKVSEILIKPDDLNSILVGVDFGVSSTGKILGEGILVRTIDGGATWDKFETPSSVTALAADPNNPDIVYTAKRRTGQIYRISDVWGNSTTTEITPGEGIEDVRDIAVYSDSCVYVATSAGLWSWNGTDWTILSGLPGSDITALAIDRSLNPAIIYAGTKGEGIFVSDDGGSTWTSFNQGLSNYINHYISRLAISAGKPEILYAGTEYSGVWTRSIQKPYPILKGDVNNNNIVDLSDAVLALKVCCGIRSENDVNLKADVNNDGHIGLAEVIYVLQCGAGTQ